MEVVPLPLELGGGVHLVRHDARDGLMENCQIVGSLSNQPTYLNLCMLKSLELEFAQKGMDKWNEYSV